jgi:AcrR family transcriptional regulator
VNDQTAVVTRRGETYGGRSRVERAVERRERIVASAVHLFGTRDYEAVTVADVCAGAKVSKRCFYEHFADRHDLILKVHREQNEWLLARVTHAAPEHPATVGDLLRPALRTLVGLLSEHPERARVIYINAPRMETRRRGVLRRDAQFLAHFLGRAPLHIDDPLRYERTLLALVAGISEVIIGWITNDMADSPDVLADHLTGICLSLLSVHTT